MPAKRVTPAQLKAAVKALGITVPVRAAFWKGTQIVLRTRAGDYAYTPTTTKRRASKAHA